MIDPHDPGPLPTLSTRRYEVTTQRKLIVYAATPEDAKLRVGIALSGSEVVSIVEVPPDPGHGPSVDKAPSRETRG